MMSILRIRNTFGSESDTFSDKEIKSLYTPLLK